MYSQEEMREIMDAGLHNDTWHDKQESNRWRKTGWKIMAIGGDYKPYVLERGFATREDAIACIEECGMQGVWVKEASMEDDDYYMSGEKGYWSSMSDEEYEYFSERLDEGMIFD